ncbi:MAG: VOC family protein [Leptospiraceae bacterium]|nr:VOC family protein [Leptospiraceae bacterium]
MKFNPGFVTEELISSRDFYVKYFGFSVKFENDFYVLLENIEARFELSFLKPNHASQNPVFQPKYSTGGYLTIEVGNVDAEYKRLKSLGCKIHMETRDEPWGDRHFIVLDPNGIGVDVVTFRGD